MTDLPPDAITVLVYPTHVGTCLRPQGLGPGRFSRSTAARVTRQADADVVLFTEVQSPLARYRLRMTYPWRKWCRAGARPPSVSRSSAGTIALARRPRFRKLQTSSNKLISRYLDRWHPVRRRTVLDVFDRFTDSERRFIPVHPWALGPNPSQEVREGHARQVERYASAAKHGLQAGMRVIVGGDTNETDDGDTPISRALAEHGIRNAQPHGKTYARIIEAFVSSGYRVLGYRLLDADDIGSDHFGIVLTVTDR